MPVIKNVPEYSEWGLFGHWMLWWRYKWFWDSLIVRLYQSQPWKIVTPDVQYRGVHYKVLALEEIFKKGFPWNIIGRRHQEIYPKLEEKVGVKYYGPKIGRKLEENIP